MKKAIGMFVALIIALGMTGVAYASWYEYLYIDGTVYTGKLDVEWSLGENWDIEPPEKDVSWVEAEIIGDTLYVWVYNAYPSIDYYVNFDVHNSGSIPVHLYWWVDYNDLPADLGIRFIEQGYQLHPSDVVYGTLHIHLPQWAEEGETYYFEIDLYAVQWNEPDGPPG